MTLTTQPAGTSISDAAYAEIAQWAPTQRWWPGTADQKPEPWLEALLPQGSQARADAGIPVLALMKVGNTTLQVPLIVSPADSSPSPAVEPANTTPAVEPANAVSDGRNPGTPANPSTSPTWTDGAQSPVIWSAFLDEAGITSVDTSGGKTLSGEQSNTSVILPNVRPEGAPHGAMMKIMRTVAPGIHPDVEVPQALTNAGFTGTPRYLGSVMLPGHGHVAVAAALVPNARDGFEWACAFAKDNKDFTAQAHELGTVVADLHLKLAESLPAHATLDPHTFVEGLRTRAANAIDAAPDALAPLTDQITAVLDDLESRLTAVPLQRIHGDLHLGQALYGATGWQLLDFEGEPQRPVEQRTTPDLPLRDVAGMLRSFHYAAAVGGATSETWTGDAQDAFLDGYLAGRAAFTAQDQAILRALTLDKALYEVVYEARQRPHWLHIPLSAVQALVA
ncbi:MAG: phosphotransferase [Cellulomonadaceae bacterium]|jgi:maltokinase|nr:phosphotransferase [Cellulomonadaceae bacterium]